MSTFVDSLTFARFLGKHPSEQLHSPVSLRLFGTWHVAHEEMNIFVLKLMTCYWMPPIQWRCPPVPRGKIWKWIPYDPVISRYQTMPSGVSSWEEFTSSRFHEKNTWQHHEFTVVVKSSLMGEVCFCLKW